MDDNQIVDCVDGIPEAVVNQLYCCTSITSPLLMNQDVMRSLRFSRDFKKLLIAKFGKNYWKQSFLPLPFNWVKSDGQLKTVFHNADFSFNGPSLARIEMRAVYLQTLWQQHKMKLPRAQSQMSDSLVPSPPFLPRVLPTAALVECSGGMRDVTVPALASDDYFMPIDCYHESFASSIFEFHDQEQSDTMSFDEATDASPSSPGV